MKLLYLIPGALLVAITVWLLWITGKPRRMEAVNRELKEQLDHLLPTNSGEGNHITTYTNLETLIDTLRSEIANAKDHVHMEFFKFEDDATGRQLADVMAMRAERGVEVRLLYDDFACRHYRRLYRDLRSHRVEVVGYNPLHWPIPIKKDYYRNHRKLVVIDGSVAYIGGMNIADRYVHGLDWGCWRDTMIRVEGPSAALAQHIFITDWCYSTKQISLSTKYFPNVPVAGTTPLRLIPSGPIGDGPTIMHYTAGLLHRAKRYAWFESPYFIPTDEIQEAMFGAAQRGVDVRLLLPPRGDQGEGTQLASKSYFARAMDAGVRIGIYRPGYMHSKIIVCDDTIAMVGSCNIDPRSHLLCQEVAAVIEDSNYARELKEIFLADSSASTYIDPAEWANRPCKQRLAETLMRQVASLL